MTFIQELIWLYSCCLSYMTIQWPLVFSWLVGEGEGGRRREWRVKYTLIEEISGKLQFQWGFVDGWTTHEQIFIENSISPDFSLQCIPLLHLSFNIMFIQCCRFSNHKDSTMHCDKSLGEFRAIAWSAVGNKCYSTEFSEVKNIAGYSTEPQTITSYSWEYCQV